MAACGVDESWVCPPGGYAERDAGGRLTGYFEEKAKAPFNSFFNTVTKEHFQQGVLEAQDYYFSQGITTIQDGSGHGPEKLGWYRELAEAGKLKADVVVYIAPDPKDPEFWDKAVAECGNRVYKNHLKIGGVKLVLDGSPQARTAWMRQPYEGETEYVAYPLHTDAWVRDVLDRCIKAGLQPIAHCNGDAAAQQFIDQWEAAVQAAGQGTQLRPIMIHAQTVGFDQLDRMKALGMHPSFFVGHCWFWGDTHLKNFGDRGKRISPVRAALDRGLVPNFHQDCPVTRPDMLHSIWCAVNRVTRAGVKIGPDQAITAEEAVRAATVGGAFAYFEDSKKGVLRPGAVADLVILDKDPTAVKPMAIRDIQVLRTIKDGKTVYQA
jgi:predicted amidohydrolase YtcJ